MTEVQQYRKLHDDGEEQMVGWRDVLIPCLGKPDRDGFKYLAAQDLVHIK